MHTKQCILSLTSLCTPLLALQGNVEHLILFLRLDVHHLHLTSVWQDARLALMLLLLLLLVLVMVQRLAHGKPGAASILRKTKRVRHGRRLLRLAAGGVLPSECCLEISQTLSPII